MNRRRFLWTSATTTSVTALSGCLSGLFETRPVYAPPPLVENRPDAVYYPTHTEGMEMVGTQTDRWYTAALSFSYPHRFWTVTGQHRQKVELQENDTVHLMVNIWDTETRTVPPNANLRVDVTKDGESVASKALWPMLSQNMGYHFGDNVGLSGDGTYTVTVSVGPLDVRRTGAHQGKFGESASLTFSVEYSRKQRNEIEFERLAEKEGKKGAVDPMEMKSVPSTQLPRAEELPGQTVGRATSGDGVFVATLLDHPPAGIDTTGRYLAVSARTPYNRYPLPFMSLSGTLERDGTTTFDGNLIPTLDPTLDYHYGTTVEDSAVGDTLTLSVGAPPQVARHEGYETAFFDMPSMTVPIKSG